MGAPTGRSPTSSSSPRTRSILTCATSSRSSKSILVCTSRGWSRADRSHRQGIRKPVSQLHAGLHAELREHRPEVGTHGVNGDTQGRCRGLVRVSLTDEGGDAPFGVREGSPSGRRRGGRGGPFGAAGAGLAHRALHAATEGPGSHVVVLVPGPVELGQRFGTA